MFISHGFDLRAIAAVGHNGQVGLHSNVPWANDAARQKEHVDWFNAFTRDSICIYGRRTYPMVRHLDVKTCEVTPEGVFPHIDSEGHKRFFVEDEIAVQPLTFLRQTVDLLNMPGKTIWIVGGAATWKRYLPFISKLVISNVDYNGPADTFMPAFSFASYLEREKQISDLKEEVNRLNMECYKLRHLNVEQWLEQKTKEYDNEAASVSGGPAASMMSGFSHLPFPEDESDH